MRYIFSCIVILTIFLFTNVASSQINAGFVQGLWYSKTEFFADETIRIYSAIQNQSDYDITGTVQFVVNGEIIGSKQFSAISGRLIESWSDWKVKEGNNRVYVQIINAKKNVLGLSPEDIKIAFSKSQEDNMVIEKDTDGDGIGNSKDIDDDNDSLSDKKEEELGTDPLKKDTDGDGLDDAEEQNRGTDPTKADNTSYNTESYALGNSISGTIKKENYGGKTASVENKTDTIKRNITQFPSYFSHTTDSIADKLKTLKNPKKSTAYNSFLDFLIFILKHKILLVIVLLAALIVGIKVLRFILRLFRRREH